MVEEPSTSRHEPSTKNEIATVVAILRQLQPADLKEHPELIQEGTRLFERTIKTKLFGDDSVVDFLKQQSEYRFLLKRLERVQEEVERNHAALVRPFSHSCLIHLLSLCLLFICCLSNQLPTTINLMFRYNKLAVLPSIPCVKPKLQKSM